MKKLIIVLAKILLSILFFSELAVAHTQSGAIGRKKLKAGGNDMFVVSCFNDGAGEPDHLSLHVFDTQPRNPAKISIQAMSQVTGAATAISTDAADSDASPSPDISLISGAGPYLMSVTKTRSRKIGAEIYLLEYHCESATGAHIGTTEAEMVKNQ